MGAAPRNSSAVRLLLADADPQVRRVLRQALESRIARPLSIVEAADTDAATTALAERGFDAVAVDLATVGGAEAFGRLVGDARTLAYAMGPAADVQAAVAVVREGAADYIGKPVDGAAFARRIERHFVSAAIEVPPRFEGLTGDAPAMRALFEQITRVAPAPAPVFIFGESGTGKALAARAVHAHSRRRAGPFVAVDCAGKTGEALIADLADPGGAIDRAAGGTLFLDEVGRLPESVQALVLRFVETGEIGGPADRRRVDARLVACSNRPAGELAHGVGVRPDLYFRLAVLTLHLPPLRERREDVPALADDLLRRAVRETGGRAPRLSGEALHLLSSHGWPGNLRELKTVMDALAAGGPGVIDADGIADVLARHGGVEPVAASPVVRPLWMEEARIIESAIAAFGGNIARAAAALEISPSTIYRKRKGLGDRDADDGDERRYG